MKRKLAARAGRSAAESPPAKERSLDVARKQRSRLSRRRRLHISPIVQQCVASSHLTELSEVSHESSVASVGNQNPPEFRRVVTRSYYRKKFKNVSSNCEAAPELSENSELKQKSADVEELEVEGEEVTKPEVSSTSRFSFAGNDVGKVTENESAVEIPDVQSIFHEEITNSKAEEDNSSEDCTLSLHSTERTAKTSENRAASGDLQFPKLVAFGINLACSEQFSNGGVINGGEEDDEVHSSSSSEIYHVISDSEFTSSDYTPSFWSYASGSQFSEKSVGEDNSSPTYELFREFKQQFFRSDFAFKAFDDHNSHEMNVLGLENEEEEESYRMMRKRERRQEYVRDYAEEYCNNTAYGELVIQQRLQMVHWIVEQATKKELQKETMFLGVSLLDRFLSKGYFRNVRNLQIAGISCLTLATRFEENQPYNCVRIKTFNVGGTMYSRCEVVAMEWVVQEVLNFQCFLPTLYNFLWFYLKAARANENVEKTTKYLAILTLMGHQQLCYWPSTVAAGLVILASIAANEDASCHLVTAIHARENDKDLPECIKSLEWLVKYL
ncbi:hypothetical protein MIMGU_mgv1a024744mg [Erythranthe guttata]|uniref:Cyclin-like domain-containing protein n=1 Tax=Erythranthe guttata TaxID=4155 RepID=A0A022QQB9_ERYGU|nr:hypothetical protein MIMGU_mgv1a024744mg [Erythranthe guttata]